MRRWNCEHCGRTLRARLEVRILFHPCRPHWMPETLGVKIRLPEIRDTIEDRRSELWEGFQAALPGEVLLRRID